MARENLSPQQWAGRRQSRVRAAAHGFANDQRWTLGRIKTLIGRLFHVGYPPEGVWKLMRRHGWFCQVSVRQALERDDVAVARRPAGGPGTRRRRRAGQHRRVACYRPGDRPHLFYKLRAYRRRRGEAKGFTCAGPRASPGRERPTKDE